MNRIDKVLIPCRVLGDLDFKTCLLRVFAQRISLNTLSGIGGFGPSARKRAILQANQGLNTLSGIGGFGQMAPVNCLANSMMSLNTLSGIGGFGPSLSHLVYGTRIGLNTLSGIGGFGLKDKGQCYV